MAAEAYVLMAGHVRYKTSEASSKDDVKPKEVKEVRSPEGNFRQNPLKPTLWQESRSSNKSIGWMPWH